MTGEMQRDLGRAEGRLDSVEADLHDLKKDVKAIREILSETKGSWRALVAVAGLAGAIGAGLAKIIPFIPIGR